MGSLFIDLNVDEKTEEKQWTFKDANLSDFGVNENSRYQKKFFRDVKVSIDNNAINNSLKNIFLFQKGERVLNPEFGNNLHKFIYEPLNEITIERITIELKEIFERWEPRIKVLDMQLIEFAETNTIQIIIVYRIPALKDNNAGFEFAIDIRR